jgi:hypothetical protein
MLVLEEESILPATRGWMSGGLAHPQPAETSSPFSPICLIESVNAET